MTIATVSEVRRDIESIERVDIRNCCKAIYVLGAARVSEIVGKLSPGDKGHKMAYGIKGTDISLTEYQPIEIRPTEVLQILGNPEKAKELLTPKPLALFRVKIAKRHLVKGEEAKSRVVALPLEKQYEPWTQELYDYCKKAKDNYVFPFTRQEVWHWITHEEPIFKGLTYPVENYKFKPKIEGPNGFKIEVITVPSHNHVFKLHGLRHIRVNELMEDYEFDGFDYAAYVGWSLTRPQRSEAPQAPPMLRVYATQIYESGWKRYIKKLLKPQVKA